MILVITRAAQRDLDNIVEYLALNGLTAAEQTLGRLADVIGQIASGELKGPRVQLQGGRPALRWSVPPYRVYYRRSSRRTVIVRVYHQARRSLEES